MALPNPDEFLRTMAAYMGCDPSVVERPGVTVKGDPGRAKNHVSAGYRLGEHFVVTCDPAAEAMLRGATVGMEPTLDAWADVAASAGGELLGAGRMQLRTRDIDLPGLPDGWAYRSLRRDDPEDRELINRLIDESSFEDLDESEVAIDSLDEIIEVVLDADERIVGYASAGPFAMALPYGDITVLTHERARGQGVGAAAVAAVSQRILDVGMEPLYRCDETNAGSVRLSEKLGFEPVTKLIGYRFTTTRDPEQ